VTLDPRRAQIWSAMGMGPQYRLRSSVDSQEALAERSAVTSAPVLLAQSSAVAVAPDRAAGIAMLKWQDLSNAVAGCRACALCETRKQTVFGVGHLEARWMLVGEAPGAEEDARGEPFVGQAGRLLDNMLASIGLTRQGATPSSVYIANVLKCRPPGNRNPQPEEVALCEPFLKRQISLVEPDLIVVMGRFAAQSLLGTEASIASLRGKAHRIRVGTREIPVVVTYHPADLLRNLADKAKSWADLCLARDVQANESARRSGPPNRIAAD